VIKRINTEQLSAGAVILAGFFVLFAGVAYFSNGDDYRELRSSQVERDAAIERARNGDGTYEFSTGFTPGIGQQVSPEQLKNDFKSSNPDGITN
jgi:hypothetical protein